MTYPPGNSGYQPAQPSGSYGASYGASYGGSTPSFAKSSDGASKLPVYLQGAVVALGFVAYLASFGPALTATEGEFIGLRGHVGLAMPLIVLAALLAAAGLLPKAKNYTPIIAVTATLGALLAIARIVNKDDSYTVGWGLWLVLVLSVLQAGAAIGGLLLEAGVVTAPVRQPKYDPYAPYGLPPGGGYYGQPSTHHGFGHHSQQHSAYQSYGGYPSGPSTGGFGTGPQQSQSQPLGQSTPPTGFPSYGTPSPGPGGSSGTAGSGAASTGGQSAADPGQASPSSSSAPSGPAQP